MSVLVVGGAGYIGSHTVKFLKQNGIDAAVLDNLSEGHKQAARGADLFVGDLRDPEFLGAVFKNRKWDAVMHFAAHCYVGESMSDPEKYYRNNTVGMLNLLSAMREASVRKFIFSSSCATYGEPDAVPITESCPQAPTNTYGFTKFVGERMLNDWRRAYGFEYVSLRYFNAAGCDPEGELGEDHDPETHLIPLVLFAASGKREKVQIYGTDYPTPDGTCVRDYIHITDLASAHFLALKRLLDGGTSAFYNLGSETGYSVRQVIDKVKDITGKNFKVEEVARRPGDPPKLVADSAKIIRELGWTRKYSDLDTIVSSAWNWHLRHPNGYDKTKR
jgi:UDP-glucose 4-epimerase